jgi:hypothetical protein
LPSIGLIVCPNCRVNVALHRVVLLVRDNDAGATVTLIRSGDATTKLRTHSGMGHDRDGDELTQSGL